MYQDYLWKAAFRVFIRDFVKFFFPEEYDKIDWTKGVTFLDKELANLHPNADAKNRIADVLVQLWLKDGAEIWVFLHIEVQGYTDSEFSRRMHQMRYRIEDLFGQNPAMLGILTDDNDKFRPNQYMVSTWGSTCRTTFLTYKVMDNPPAIFPNPDNPVSIIMEVAYHATQAKKTSDEDLMKLHLPLVKKLLTKGYSKKATKMLLSFVEGYIKFGNSQNIRIFGQKIDNMVKYETTADIFRILEKKRLEHKKWLAIQEMEELRQEIKQNREEHARLEQEREKERQEHARLEQEREKERQEHARLEQEREKVILSLISQGFDRAIIAQSFVMTLEQIELIEKKYAK